MERSTPAAGCCSAGGTADAGHGPGRALRAAGRAGRLPKLSREQPTWSRPHWPGGCRCSSTRSAPWPQPGSAGDGRAARAASRKSSALTLLWAPVQRMEVEFLRELEYDGATATRVPTPKRRHISRSRRASRRRQRRVGIVRRSDSSRRCRRRSGSRSWHVPEFGMPASHAPLNGFIAEFCIESSGSRVELMHGELDFSRSMVGCPVPYARHGGSPHSPAPRLLSDHQCLDDHESAPHKDGQIGRTSRDHPHQSDEAA
jgi:hypothetical protein